MREKYPQFILLARLVVVWVFLSAASSVSAGVVIADLENALMCKCDDECGKVMINCTCDTSKETRQDFRKKLESGLTVEQVIQVYVDKYGETVLSAPTKSGFNLTAWLTPFAAILGGGLGIRKVVQAWLRKNRSGSSSSREEKEISSTDVGKYSKQLRDELDKIET